MKPISIQDIWDLASSQTTDKEVGIRTVFEWEFQRSLEIGKLWIQLAASFLVALATAYVTGAVRLSQQELAVSLVGNAIAIGYGYLRMSSSGVVWKQYLLGINLMSQLAKVEHSLDREGS